MPLKKVGVAALFPFFPHLITSPAFHNLSSASARGILISGKVKPSVWRGHAKMIKIHLASTVWAFMDLPPSMLTFSVPQDTIARGLAIDSVGHGAAIAIWHSAGKSELKRFSDVSRHKGMWRNVKGRLACLKKKNIRSLHLDILISVALESWTPCNVYT